MPALRSTDFINTIPPEREPWFPGDEEMERQIRRLIRWNAAVMVSSANRKGLEVGGHIATYASAASLYEVGYNHFFRGKDHPGGGDQLYIQGHASPGIYARAYLMKRLTAEQLGRFRQEVQHGPGPGPVVLPAPAPDAGLLGVPHGLDGPRRRSTRSTRPASTATCTTAASRTPASSTCGRSSATARWASPSRSARSGVAAREELDNLTFVINCNLQQLDGPVTRQRQDHPGARVHTSAAPAGTSSRSSGAASGTPCSPRTSTACWSTR